MHGHGRSFIMLGCCIKAPDCFCLASHGCITPSFSWSHCLLVVMVQITSFLVVALSFPPPVVPPRQRSGFCCLRLAAQVRRPSKRISCATQDGVFVTSSYDPSSHFEDPWSNAIACNARNMRLEEAPWPRPFPKEMHPDRVDGG